MTRIRTRLLLLGCALVVLLFPAWYGAGVALGQGNSDGGTSIYLPLVLDGRIDLVEEENPSPERSALEALYLSTQGQSWTNNTDWLQTDTPCTWYGITCEQNNVVALNLQQNNLSGVLPSEIGNLTFLRDLNVYENGLSQLPSTIGSLTNLQHVDISHNQVASLPAEIGGLDSLLELDMENNLLSSLPPEIGGLASLEDLNVSKNQLTSLPSQLGNLANLKGLYLWDNKLSQLPPEVGNLANLEALYSWSNQITELPSELGSLTKFQWIIVSSNELTSLPTEMTTLSPNQLDVAQNCMGALAEPTLVSWLDTYDPDWKPMQRSNCTP